MLLRGAGLGAALPSAERLALPPWQAASKHDANTSQAQRRDTPGSLVRAYVPPKPAVLTEAAPMRLQLTLIGRHFEDGLRLLAQRPHDPEARAGAENAYKVGARQLARVPWERVWAPRLTELFRLQQALRARLDGELGEEAPLSGVR